MTLLIDTGIVVLALATGFVIDIFVRKHHYSDEEDMALTIAMPICTVILLLIKNFG